MVAPVLLAQQAKAGGPGQPHIHSEFGIHENHLKNKQKTNIKIKPSKPKQVSSCQLMVSELLLSRTLSYEPGPAARRAEAEQTQVLGGAGQSQVLAFPTPCSCTAFCRSFWGTSNKCFMARDIQKWLSAAGKLMNRWSSHTRVSFNERECCCGNMKKPCVKSTDV